MVGGIQRRWGGADPAQCLGLDLICGHKKRGDVAYVQFPTKACRDVGVQDLG